jgi:hypothetical protein
MTKPHRKTIEVIVILLMLGASPLSVTYSFADLGDYQEEGKKVQNIETTTKSIQKERLGAILTEKIVDGKLKAQYYELPDNITAEDMQRMLSFEGETSSWAYVNAKAYNSGIVLFDGKASKIGENLWKISANGVLNLGERQFGLELNGKSNDFHAVRHGTASDEDLNYRVIFSGKVVEIDEEHVFAIFFMNSGIKNPEMDQNIRFLQIGELTTNSEKSIGSNQEFRNSISVR